MNKLDMITKNQLNPNVPEFRVGDNVRVNAIITEGKRKRIQAFEGLVIARKGHGVSETFTVYKTSSGVGVERIFPLHSPKIESIEVLRRGKVRRAKLNYIKDFIGQYKIKEKR